MRVVPLNKGEYCHCHHRLDECSNGTGFSGDRRIFQIVILVDKPVDLIERWEGEWG